jgi:hypothetical protein
LYDVSFQIVNFFRLYSINQYLPSSLSSIKLNMIILMTFKRDLFLTTCQWHLFSKRVILLLLLKKTNYSNRTSPTRWSWVFCCFIRIGTTDIINFFIFFGRQYKAAFGSWYDYKKYIIFFSCLSKQSKTQLPFWIPVDQFFYCERNRIDQSDKRHNQLLKLFHKMRSICSRQILPKELTKFQEASNYFETFVVTIIQRCVELKSRSREKNEHFREKICFCGVVTCFRTKIGTQVAYCSSSNQSIVFSFSSLSVLFLIMCLYQTIKLLFVKTSQFLFSSCRNNLICHIFFNLMS